MADSSYPAYPIFAFLSVVLVLIPLPWHFQAWNAGTCLYMLWTALACLNSFVNSVVWHANAIDHAPIWCDISTKISVATAVAIPAASLCINRRLYRIASVQNVSISRADKRRAVIEDLGIGLGIPFLQMVLQFIVQGHRYNIFEDIGCYPTTFNTPIAYPLTLVWPTVLGLISAVYCLLTLRAFMIRRAQFSQFLSSNSSLTVNRYFRLMALATVELLFDTPISAYGIYLNVVANPMLPWKGWADAHFDWFAVDLVPAVVWRSNYQTTVSLELSRWSLIFCALVFFGFFGFADEARKHYRIIFIAVTTRLRIPLPASKSVSLNRYQKGPFMASTASSLPLYVSRAQSHNPSKQSSTSTSFSMTPYKGDHPPPLYQSPVTVDFNTTSDIPPTPGSTQSSSRSVFSSDDHHGEAIRALA